VVVRDLDVVGVTTPPSEADPPLVIDPDAVLPLPITAQSFQPVARRDAQVVQAVRSVQHPELPQCHPLHIGSKPPDGVPFEQPLGVSIAEALDHDV
jgi:hypothetical protein